jgi:hypothetical protein
MDLDLARLSELTPNVVAAVVGALVTLAAALINLRIAWRREVLDRLQGTRGGKPRRGLLPAIAFIAIAAAGGGYALALYLMQAREAENLQLRDELRQRATQIQNSAERIEGSRVLERYTVLADARLAEERRRGADGVSAATRLPPCRARTDEPCREDDAVRSAVCAAMPPRAVPLEVGVWAVMMGGDGAVAYAPSTLGADLGTAKIGAKPVERAHADGKLLCLDAWSWDMQHALELRILVRYVLGDVAPPAPPAPAAAASTVAGAS